MNKLEGIMPMKLVLPTTALKIDKSEFQVSTYLILNLEKYTIHKSTYMLLIWYTAGMLTLNNFKHCMKPYMILLNGTPT